MDQPRKRGGQPKDPAERKRNNLTFRVRDRIRSILEEAATEAGRSVSEEIEYRVERSFQDDRILELYKDLQERHELLKYQYSDVLPKAELKSAVEAAVAPAIEQFTQALERITQALEHAGLVKPARKPSKTE